MLRPMGCAATLRAHRGCVNRLAWSEDGSVLASVSDDTRLVLWRAAPTGASPWAREVAHAVPSRHRGNMFGVAFLPLTGARQLVTSAMDGQIRWLEQTPTGWDVRLLAQTGGSVNAVAVGDAPHTAYAACETGQVFAVDTRTARSLDEPPPRSRGGGDVSNCRTLLALQPTGAHRGGERLQATSVAVSAANPHVLAVGASDQFVRLYDTRALPAVGGAGSARHRHHNVLHFCPLHLAPDATRLPLPPSGGVGPARARGPRHRRRHVPPGVHTTHVEFDTSGRWLAAAISGDANYVFDTREREAPLRVGDSANAVHWAGDERAELSGASTVPRAARATTTTATTIATDVGPLAPGAPAPRPQPPPHTPLDAAPQTGAVGAPAASASAAAASPASAPAASASAIATAETARLAGDLTRAVRFYMLALAGAEAAGVPPSTPRTLLPRIDGLLARRATALLQRGATGDASDAVADCVRALELAATSGRAAAATRNRLAVALRGAGQLCAALRVAEALLDSHDSAGGGGGVSAARHATAAATAVTAAAAAAEPPPSPRQAEEEAAEAAEAAAALDEARALVASLRGELAAEAAEEDARRVADEDILLGLGGDGDGHGHADAAEEPASAAPQSSSSSSSGMRARNAGRGYPVAFPDDEAGGESDSEFDPQLLCTRHALRCAGGRNMATGIKEVAFWGGSSADTLRELAAGAPLARQLGGGGGGARDGDWGGGGFLPAPGGGFMVAGCDSGHVLVFDRTTGLLVAALPDDADVTNCVRPHATLPVLAAGGIAHTVRVWAPTPPEGADEEAVVEEEAAAVEEAAGAAEAEVARSRRLWRRGALPRDDDEEEEEEAEAAAARGGGGGSRRRRWKRALCAPDDAVELDALATRNTRRPPLRGGGGMMLGRAELAALLASVRRGGEGGEDDDDEDEDDDGQGGLGVRCAQQ